MTDPKNDPRIDPRTKTIFGEALTGLPAPDVASRDELLAVYQSAAGEEAMAGLRAFLETIVEPIGEDGFDIVTEQVRSSPDGNLINLQIVKPSGASGPLPCVYHIHGGGMQFLSCFDSQFQSWSRRVARRGVAVVLVDFRNALYPSSVPEIAPYPAGLNDCVSGLRWVHAHAAKLGIDPARIIVSGDSGGGNLALATAMKLKRDGDIGLISGIFALCPYLAGEWPRAENPSSVTSNGIMMDLHNNRAAMAYGIEAFRNRDPLAWAGFASEEDVAGLPSTIISVNECDPLCDEGITFYRLLVRAGVEARCSMHMGMVHVAETFSVISPAFSELQAGAVADFARMAR